MPTVAINGLGRIGRAALKILLDSDGLELAAVNDIAAADNLAIHVAVAEGPPGHVLVVSVGVEHDYGYWGEVLTTGAEVRGIVGLVIDGGVRDISALEAHGFPAFSALIALRGATKEHPGRIGGQSVVGDVVVHEGDWIQLENGKQGRVRAIRWRHTVVETRDWSTIVVPNALLLQNNITILGWRDGAPAPQRMWVYFNVDFRFAPHQVIQVVTDALLNSPIENVAFLRSRTATSRCSSRSTSDCVSGTGSLDAPTKPVTPGVPFTSPQESSLSSMFTST